MFQNPDREVGERLITLCRGKPIRRMVPSDFYNRVRVPIVKCKRVNLYRDYLKENGPQTLAELAFHFKRSRSSVCHVLANACGICRGSNGRYTIS